MFCKLEIQDLCIIQLWYHWCILIFIDSKSKSLFYLIKCLYYVIIIILINNINNYYLILLDVLILWVKCVHCDVCGFVLCKQSSINN